MKRTSKGQKTLIYLAVVLALQGLASLADARSYCNPDRSKPCGQGCIPLDKKCRKSWTTAISGERPSTASKHYDNPKYVETAPGETKAGK